MSDSNKRLTHLQASQLQDLLRGRDNSMIGLTNEEIAIEAERALKFPVPISSVSSAIKHYGLTMGTAAAPAAIRKWLTDNPETLTRHPQVLLARMASADLGFDVSPSTLAKNAQEANITIGLYQVQRKPIPATAPTQTELEFPAGEAADDLTALRKDMAVLARSLLVLQEHLRFMSTDINDLQRIAAQR
jgi:hypothetical protein